MKKNKKSEAGLVIVLVIIIVLFFFGWIINLSQRECKSNKDCGSEAYCGSDFSCHSYPIIEKTIVKYNLFWPALILGIAIVISTIIFRWDKIRKEETVEEQKINIKEAKEEPEEVVEPYYKSTANTKSP